MHVGNLTCRWLVPLVGILLHVGTVHDLLKKSDT